MIFIVLINWYSVVYNFKKKNSGLNLKFRKKNLCYN